MAEVPTEALEAATRIWWQYQADGNRAVGAPVSVLREIVAAGRAQAAAVIAEKLTEALRTEAARVATAAVRDELLHAAAVEHLPHWCGVCLSAGLAAEGSGDRTEGAAARIAEEGDTR